MGTLSYISGLGPVDLAILFPIAAIVAGALVFRHAKEREGGVEWHWVIGIALLFLMGIVPGLVGLWLYRSTRERRTAGGGDSGERTESPWTLNLVFFLAMSSAGLAATIAVASLGLADVGFWVLIGAFFVGATAAFLVLSYLRFGR